MQETERVVKTFVQQPYSLLTLAAAKVSAMVGCHCGRTERIKKLPVPKLVHDHLAFKADNFKLACEKEAEEKQKVEKQADAPMEEWEIMNPDDIFDDDDDHFYSEEEGEDDDGDGE